MMESRFIKCVTVGDGAVGKTCLLISHTSNTFPTNDDQFFINHPGAVPKTTLQGEKLRKLIGAPAYIECSSKTQQNAKAVFGAAIKVVLQQPKQKKKKKRKSQNRRKVLGRRHIISSQSDYFTISVEDESNFARVYSDLIENFRAPKQICITLSMLF